MVVPFRLSNIPQIEFGCGSFKNLVQGIFGFGDSALILTGKSSFSAHLYQLKEDLDQNNITAFFDIVDQEPTPGIVDLIVKKNRNNKVDVVVAIGGGSVLDAGKAISAMLPLLEPVKDYLEGVGNKTPNGVKVPFIAIPTTSGTGSEMTKNAVISEVGKEGFKKSLRHNNYIPNLAIVDPELTVNCSPELTVATGMDALTQLMESYLSVKATEITDVLALDGINKIFNNIVEVCEDGSNLKARSAMSYAAMLSGITLANAGLGTVHGFASSVGGVFPIPHGVVCGTLMGICNKFTIDRIKKKKENAAFEKYVVLGKMLTHSHTKNDLYYLDYLNDFLNELTLDLKMPLLSKYGVSESDIVQIAEKTDNKNNPVKLSTDELTEILRLRL